MLHGLETADDLAASGQVVSNYHHVSVYSLNLQHQTVIERGSIKPFIQAALLLHFTPLLHADQAGVRPQDLE